MISHSSQIELPWTAPAGESCPRILLALVTLTIAASGYVMIEPAPCDLLFVLTMGVAIATSKPLLSRRVNSFAYTGLAIFAVANCISAVFSENVAGAIRYGGITAYMFAGWICLSAWIARYGDSLARWVTRGYLTAAGVTAAIGVLARFNLVPNSQAFMMVGTGTRVRGTFKDPNVFAPFLVAAFILLLSDMIAGGRRPLLKFALLMLYGIAILFSVSRGAMIHLAISMTVLAMLYLLVIRNRSATARWMQLSCLCLLMLPPVGFYALTQLHLWDLFTSRLSMQGYDSQRFDAQTRAVRVGLESPFGIGPGQWDKDLFAIETHSLYARAFVENSLLGLAGLALFLGGCLICGWRAVARRDQNSYLAAAALAVCVGAIVESAVIDTIHWRHFFLFLAIMVGLDAYGRNNQLAAATTAPPGDNLVANR